MLNKRRLGGYFTEPKNLNLARRPRSEGQKDYGDAVSKRGIVGGYWPTHTTLEDVSDLLQIKEKYSE